MMRDRPQVKGIVPYVFCTDAGAVADWCLDLKPPVERDFGIRMVSVTDPEGHEWGFMRRT